MKIAVEFDIEIDVVLAAEKEAGRLLNWKIDNAYNS